MDLPVVEKPVPAILLNSDNQTMIIKVNSSKDNMKSFWHVKRRLKSIKKLKNSEVITLEYVQTAKNMTYQFTKGLSCNVINSASSERGLRPTWSYTIVVTYPMWSEIPWIWLAKQAIVWLGWETLKCAYFFDVLLSLSVWQVGSYLNMIRVAFLKIEMLAYRTS